MNTIEAKKICAVLAAAFPGSNFPPETRDAYIRMLSDIDYLEANAAVEQLLAEREFLPTIASIRKAAMRVRNGPVRAGAEAWGDFLQAVSTFGIYRTPKFSDPVVAQVVDALNWKELCNSENQVADRARFIEAYDQMASRAQADALTLGLPARQRYEAIHGVREADQVSADVAIAKLLRFLPKAERDELADYEGDSGKSKP